MLRACVSVCLFAVLAAFTSTPAIAQTSDNRTYFTFSQPVTLPGLTLPAGMYVFRIVDTTGSRRTIEVQDAAGRHYGMMMSVPIHGDRVSAEPQVRFMEGMEGTVQAIRAWWYPGTSIGYEFVYPREQAMRLADRARTSVLTTANAVTDSDGMKSSDLTRVSSSSSDATPRASEAIKEAPVMFDMPPMLPPLLPESAAPLTPWLGAMSFAMAVSQHGPRLGL